MEYLTIPSYIERIWYLATIVAWYNNQMSESGTLQQKLHGAILKLLSYEWYHATIVTWYHILIL